MATFDQTAVAQRANPKNRIIYVEPNDVYDVDADGRHQGLQFTPKYEDFCISFNLIIESFSRLDKKKMQAKDVNGRVNDDEQNTRKTYTISWSATKDELRRRKNSVLEGNKGDMTINNDGTVDFPYEAKYNYLTTYYTDISHDTYGKKTEIEGLGVESVQISYESWYTPTVVIKFVDVRGSALFGREEAIHLDEKLQAENVFGAFFTMPYPLFRLQVKGFLGKPVTYQLTCSNFKGEFNSQTGNFEAVATFLGYSWSFLTDIPFTYLVAAPYSTYKGKDYWDRNVSSNRDWQLQKHDGTTQNPPKLYKVFRRIKEAFHYNLGKGNDEQRNEIQQISEENKALTNIKNYLNNFRAQIVKDVSFYLKSYDSDTNTDQILLFSNEVKPTFSDDTVDYYKQLVECIKDYAATNFEGSTINATKIPNQWSVDTTDLNELSITFLNKFVKNADDTISVNDDLGQTITLTDLSEVEKIEKLTTIKLNEKDGKLTKQMAETLLTQLTNIPSNANITEYCYLIDFSDLSSLLNSRIDSGVRRERQIQEDIQRECDFDIGELVGFEPYIGNVFKLIFCHLETFCHIMFDSAAEIYSQMDSNYRTSSALGITLEGSGTEFPTTDIIGGPNGYTDNIAPWPAFFDEAYKDQMGYAEIKNVYGWPTDVTKRKLIEIKVVFGLQEGIQFLIEQMKNEQTPYKLTGFPILPSDYAVNHNVFGNISEVNNITDLAGYLAIRLTNIIGVTCGNSLDLNLAKLLGKLDAYNLYNKLSSVIAFTNATKDIEVKKLVNIMYCKQGDYDAYGNSQEGSDIKRFNFETEKYNSFDKRNRHPFFMDSASDSTKAEFIHFYDEKGVRYVPSTLRNFKYYTSNVEKKTGDLLYTKVGSGDNLKYCYIPNSVTSNQITESKDWLYITDSSNVNAVKDNIKTYKNDYMFKIISDDMEVASIKNKYTELKGGNLKVGNYDIKDDLTDILDKFVKLDVKHKSKFFKKNNYMLSGNSSKLNLDKSGFFGPNMTIINYDGWVERDPSDFKNHVSVNDDCELLINDEKIDLSELVIQQFRMSYYGNQCNIFGCPFYYMQNQITDNDLKLKVKALLFLHTFKYEYLNTDLNPFINGKTNGATEEVPKGYLLFLGAMLWRRRYALEHENNDPIVYSYSGTKDRIILKQCDINNTLFYRNGNNNLTFGVMEPECQIVTYDYSINSLFGGIDIDYNIENQLIELFENFASTTFNTIANQYDIITDTNIDKLLDIIHGIWLFATNPTKNIVIGTGPAVPKTGENLLKYLKKNEMTSLISNFLLANVKTYCDSKLQGLSLLFNENDQASQTLFKDLYFGTYIITDSCYRRQRKGYNTTASNTEIITIKKDIMNSYLGGFVDGCKNISATETVNVGDEEVLNVSKDVIENRDLSIAIYYYLKNLWDKWLITSDTNAFDVSTFFKQNFIFIDSFYTNIYNRLAINCEILYDTWKELADNGSLFHFLSNICSKHGCLFLPVPDYVGFNGETQKHDIEMMENLFRPLPYNEMPYPSNDNKFVVIFTHSPSHIKDESNGYPMDSYDLFSHDKYGNTTMTGVAAKLFGSTNEVDFERNNDFASRVGYNVPAFGIEFGRQNNHIFKNLKVSMDNPVMTEQSIKAQMNIAMKAGNSDHTICFIGQDTFNVFSNYSYTITVEMLGNAQIAPLMYFQLMNVPMWRGTYMIYKVEHNMTHGNMTTTITAMKMNKFAQPFNKHFFIVHHINPENGDSEDYENTCDISFDS